MESHVLHWNRKYLTVEECFRHKDGFCTLAYLFLVRIFDSCIRLLHSSFVYIFSCRRYKFCLILQKVQPGCCNCINPQLERITEHLKYVLDPDMETKIPASKDRIYVVWNIISLK